MKRLILGSAGDKVSYWTVLYIICIFTALIALAPLVKASIEQLNISPPSIYLTFIITSVALIYAIVMTYCRIHMSDKQRFFIAVFDLFTIFPLVLICGVINFIYYKPMGSKGIFWGIPLVSLYFVMLSMKKGILNYFKYRK